MGGCILEIPGLHLCPDESWNSGTQFGWYYFSKGQRSQKAYSVCTIWEIVNERLETSFPIFIKKSQIKIFLKSFLNWNSNQPKHLKLKIWGKTQDLRKFSTWDFFLRNPGPILFLWIYQMSYNISKWCHKCCAK